MGWSFKTTLKDVKNVTTKDVKQDKIIIYL